MEKNLDFRGTSLTVPTAIQELRAGRMVLMCDDENRENEADICLAAQFATPEAVNFLVHHACGIVCVAMTGERLDALHIPLATTEGNSLHGVAFTISVDASNGTTTGIPARERALTIRTLIDPGSQPEDLVRPGHIFPLRVRSGGTLERRGHTEGAVDLMRIAGLEPAAVICEVLAADGEAARGETLWEFAKQWGIGIISVDTIARFRAEQQISLIAETQLPTADATFTLLHYQEIATGQPYIVLTLGTLTNNQEKPPLLRIHSGCMTGDIFGSQRCDCQAQLHTALHAIAQEGRGMLFYLPQEGRGIGLAGKLQAYVLQDQGSDTIEANEHLGYPADARTYTHAVEILRKQAITHVRLMTNNPDKVQTLVEGGITVERIPLEVPPTTFNIDYLQTKHHRFGHLLTSV